MKSVSEEAVVYLLPVAKYVIRNLRQNTFSEWGFAMLVTNTGEKAAIQAGDVIVWRKEFRCMQILQGGIDPYYWDFPTNSRDDKYRLASVRESNQFFEFVCFLAFTLGFLIEKTDGYGAHAFVFR